MGFSVFKPRCAVPIGKPCIPVEGGGRRLADDGANASDELCLPFDSQVFEKEEIFFKLEQTTVVVVGCLRRLRFVSASLVAFVSTYHENAQSRLQIVPVEYFFLAAFTSKVNLRGALCLTASEEKLSVGLVGRAPAVLCTPRRPALHAYGVHLLFID
jgi:hypothetical protein